jgi:hypothetical protein
MMAMAMVITHQNVDDDHSSQHDNDEIPKTPSLH